MNTTAPNPPARLSPQQFRVCEMASRGFGDKQIAAELRVSFSGVRRHWERVFQKLNCHNRTVAVLLAKLQTDGWHGGNPASVKSATMRRAARRAKVTP